MKVRRTHIGTFSAYQTVDFSVPIPSNSHILDIIVGSLTSDSADLYFVHTEPDIPVYGLAGNRRFRVVASWNVSASPNEYSMYVGKVQFLPPMTVDIVDVGSKPNGEMEHRADITNGAPQTLLIFELGGDN